MRGCGGGDEEEEEEGRAAGMVSGFSVSTRRRKHINKSNEGPHPKRPKREAESVSSRGAQPTDGVMMHICTQTPTTEAASTKKNPKV